MRDHIVGDTCNLQMNMHGTYRMHDWSLFNYFAYVGGNQVWVIGRRQQPAPPSLLGFRLGGGLKFQLFERALILDNAMCVARKRRVTVV